jgi:hypothetical protein
MPLNTLGLVAGIAVAQNKGVEADQVTRVALPAAILPNTALGIVVADVLATQEASLEQQTVSAARAELAGVAVQSPVPAPAKPAQAPPGGGANGTAALGQGAPAPAPAAAPATDPLPQPWSLPAVSLAPKPPPGYRPGDVLEANPGIWQGAGTDAEPRFQWFRSGEEIHKGGSSATYTIKAADEGHDLTVEVIYGDASTGFVSTTSSPIHIPKGHRRQAEQSIEVIETTE